jgi:CO/xanthine dehydrogenase FAD-binding subunit
MDLNTVTEFVTPRSRADLDGFGDGDAFLAGGSWLFSEPQVDVRRLFDLTAFGWPSIEGSTIAATCTLAELAERSELARRCCECLRGSFKIWNVGTVGGNLCCALPAGPVAAYAVALDGVCTLWSASGEREVAALDFITGPGTTVLRPGELLRSIRVEPEPPHVALRQFSLTPIGRSAALQIGRADPFVLTITGATPKPVQITSLDEIDGLDFYDDVHGSPAWRRQLVHVLADEIRAELA